MTQTELHLCKIWSREERLGDWWRCWSTLSDISAALIWAECSPDHWQLYEDAALLAIARANLAGADAVAELDRLIAGQREAA
jgi:hypothetical protein